MHPHPPSMNLTTDLSRPLCAASAGRRLQLGGVSVTLDRGHVAVIDWPDAARQAAQLSALCQSATPVVRYASGKLIEDLSLQDNLMLEPSLLDGRLPLLMLPEIESLFAYTDCPPDWSAWADTWPGSATRQALMQVCVGRALVADPDLLVMDAAHWDDGLLQPFDFSQRFINQYPWRTLVWATHDASRADELREMLQDYLKLASS